MKVLFISQWYPHRYDKMAGLFVQKHAQAVGMYADVIVLYVHDDPNIDFFEIESIKHNNITELTIYYPIQKEKITYKFFKIINLLRAYYKGFKILKNEGFQPDIIHANILTRTGFVALLYKIIKGKPYVITEHWTRYLPDRNAYRGILRELITKIVVRNASAIFPVSRMLEKAMLSHNLFNSNYEIIDNVIDPVFSKSYPLEKRVKKRIILVSCFLEEAKNVKGILRTISKLSHQRTDFELVVIGNGLNFDEIVAFSDELNLTNKYVFFKGEKTSIEVALSIYNSDFMVLFSNFETAGVVITECIALGKPILTTRVGISEDYIGENEGVIIEVGDESALLENMNFMLDNLNNFDNELIRAKYCAKFSYQTIGQKIINSYSKVLKSD